MLYNTDGVNTANVITSDFSQANVRPCVSNINQITDGAVDTRPKIYIYIYIIHFEVYIYIQRAAPANLNVEITKTTD